MDDMLFRLQSQIEALEQEVRALQEAGDSADGTPTAVGQTFTETTYPTTCPGPWRTIWL